MSALEDGPVIWIRRFAFLPSEPEVFEEKYREWARRKAMLQQQGPVPSPEPPERLEDYPEDFLRTQAGLMLYKVLT